MQDNTAYWRGIFLCLVLLVSLCAGTASPGEGPVGIYLSSKIRPYLEALEGFKSRLGLEYQVFDMEENAELGRHYLNSGKLKAAVAIGTEAARLIYSDKSKTSARMAIMALDLERLLGRSDICGIDLRVPISFELFEIRERLGPGRTVAILYNEEENSEIIKEAQSAASGLGISVRPIPVSTPSQIMTRLGPGMASIDLILFIPDSIVITEKIVRHITKEALLKGVAVAGYNHFFYEIGALISFTIDYQKIGREGAEVLEDLLNRGQCRLLPPHADVEWNQKAFDILRKARPGNWRGIDVKVGVD